MQRESLEASLRSEFGEQRLKRGTNHLSRVTLVPREPLFHTPPVWLDWGKRVTELVIDDQPWPITLDGVQLGYGRHPLKNGATFIAGKTAITFSKTRRAWPVDLERERALLESPPEAWAVFADELIARGDPLGAALSGSGELDTSYLLEVAPRLAANEVVPVTGPGGAWSELTFKVDLMRGGPSGLYEAVLTHPVSWFVRQVTLEAKGLGYSVPEHAQFVLNELGRCGGPHLRRFIAPKKLRRTATLTSPRPEIEIVLP
ncbi:MAG: hypothetical protein QM817_07735 [Archangium sp.]